ncbi:iron complex outermembrane recepter protein [Bradyrhizobium canariense]|uniref:Iron complex outermembrane recepter protein n=1 Tax=Bradyrhizobium canariense TaxID=255045 RepID=A0A1H1M1I1_9BRAD|nr:iron complex outermembrane recepter protein [Bradyrhizobium canariense]
MSGATTLPPVIVQRLERKRTAATHSSKPQGSSGTSNRSRPGRQAPAPIVTAQGAGQSGSIPSQTPVPGYVANEGSGATKTNTPLMQTPGSISVVTHQQIVDQNAQSISEALRYTPGVIPEQRGINETSLEYLYSRGFQATTFLDGLPIAPPTNAGTGVGFNFMSRDPYFLDRIESIRGPLSVLYGQVPPGGFFNLVSKLPTEDPYHEVFFQTGSYGRAEGGFDFSGPITDDKTWLYRFTGLGLTTGTQTDFVDQQRVAIAPSVTWRPDQDTKLTLMATYQNDPKAGAYNFVPAVGTVLPGAIKIGPSFDTGNPTFDQFKKEETSVGYLFEHRFDDVWQIKQNVRYSYNDIYIQNAADGAYLTPGGTAIERNPYINQGTLGSFVIDNEAIATFNTGFLRHQVVFGVDYQNYQYDHRFLEDYTSSYSPAPLSLTNPSYQSIPLPNFLLGTSSRQSTGQTGLYAQDQIGIGKLTIVGGLREDWSTSHIESLKTLAATDQNDSALTGRIGAIYNFDNGVAPYVSYSTSFQPQLGADINGNGFLPTEGKQTEVGVKYQPVGTKNIFTIAAFDINQTNVLVSLGGGLSAQVGGVRSQGIEFEARNYLTENLQAIFSYTYDDAKNVSRLPAGFGADVQGIPYNMASAWLSYDMPTYLAPGLKLNGGARFIDGTWDNTNTIRIPSFTLVDLGAQYDFGRQFPTLKGYTASINVTNLFNKTYIASCINTAYCVYGQGRLALARLAYRW